MWYEVVVSSSSLVICQLVWGDSIIIFYGCLSDGMGWWYHHLLWVFVKWYGVVVLSSSLGICQMVWAGGVIFFFGYLSDGMGWWNHHLLLSDMIASHMAHDLSVLPVSNMIPAYMAHDLTVLPDIRYDPTKHDKR